MINLSLLVWCFIFGGLIYLYKRFYKYVDHKIPPGPKGLPLVGSVLKLDKKNPLLTFSKWSKEYGAIYSVYLGRNLSYIVSDPKMVKDLFSHDAAFSGRMKMPIIDVYSNGKSHGIINTEGEHWEQLRRFTLRQLRDFGFGKNSMEGLITEELKEILEWMKIKEGMPVEDIKGKMTIAVINSLWTILTGHRYKHDDPVLLALTRNINQSVDDMTESGGLIFFAPWLKHINPEWSGYNGMRRIMDKFRVMFTGAVDEHKSTYSEDYQRDFIDVFLKEINECKDKDSAFFGELGERQLVAVIADLFLAGSDTSSTTLSWVFLYLSIFPEVQKKLQKELDDVVGNSRFCSLFDRPSLPYTEALIAEIMRFSSIVALGVGHKTLADREFNGYFIPKGTTLFANLYYIHHDPEIFREFQTRKISKPGWKNI